MLVIVTPTLAERTGCRDHVVVRLESGSCLRVPTWRVMDLAPWVLRALEGVDGVRVERLGEDEAA